MRYLSIVLFLFAVNSIYSQNLIINGSVEELNVPCVIGRNGVNGLLKYDATNIFYYKSSPDILNECSGVAWSAFFDYQIDIPKNYLGYQWARTGIGMASYWNSTVFSQFNNKLGEEIISFKISDTLVKNKKYILRFYTVLSDSIGYATDLGEAVLSSEYSMNMPDSISYYSIISNKGKGFLDDTINWLPVFDTITATGNELFVHIGRFHKLKQINITSVNTNATPLTYPGFHLIFYFIDDVALWPCDTIAPIANAGNDTIICQGDSALIGTHNYSDYYYSWWKDSICFQNGISEIQRDEHNGKIWVKPVKSRWYYLQATDFKYDKTIDSIFIMVVECSPVMSDTTICIGDEIVIGNGNSYYSSWQWFPADFLDYPLIATPTASPPYNIIYTVITTDTIGRTHSHTISIKVKTCNLPPEIIIPNIITPNGDGINDIFKYQNEEYWIIETQIFNRWGHLLFCGGNKQRWDATFKDNEVTEGVYFYHITAQAIGFEESIKYNGTISILR